MNEERISESPSWSDPRGQVMKTPDDVAEMLRLKACGWGLKRIARELGCSHHTVKDYVAAGGVKPFKSPERRKRLDGLEEWLRERFIRHRGNADVVRQDLLAEKGVVVGRRTLQRAVQPYRQALEAEALATTRFETPPGRQLQIDFGERLVEIGDAKIKAFMFVATLGHSRRLHVRAFGAEKQEHWFAGLESAFTTFGGVPEEVLMDNPRALVVRHDAVNRSVQFNDKLIAFAKHWGFRPRACAPYRARTKGKTESGVGYVKKNAIAGHCFADWEAFEAHLAKWEREVANVRIHGTTGEAPIVRFERDEVGLVLAAAVRARDRAGPAKTLTGVDILAWEFVFGLDAEVHRLAATAGMQLLLRRIPPELLDLDAIDRPRITEFDFAPLRELTLRMTRRKRRVAVTLTDFILPPAAMPPEAQVALILAKYAILGIVPMVIPTAFPEVPLPIERIPIHHGTDLDYIQERARWVGYTFHILTPAPLVNIAYWGPKLRIGLPQSVVNIDMDAYTNVDSIHFGFENRDRAQPILQALGRTIAHFGPTGSGEAAKATNQIMVAGIIEAIAEAMAFAHAQGLPLEKLIDTLSKGAGSSWYFVHRAPNMARGSYPAGFRVRLHEKDLGICHDMAARFGTALPVVERMRKEYAELIARGYGDEDVSATFRLKEELFERTNIMRAPDRDNA